MLEAVCKVKQGVLFILFFAWCNLIIILAMDRFGQHFLFKTYTFLSRYFAIFSPLKHLSYFYKRCLLAVLLLNWLTVLGVGGWQAGVHQVGPASCQPGHHQYFLCGANTAVAKESILSSSTPEVEVEANLLTCSLYLCRYPPCTRSCRWW